MIKCPKCKKSDDIISEQPSWDHSQDNVIEIESNCISCEVDFTTTHHIGKPLAVLDVKENKLYVWG